jgi:multidrug resistance efflux pump
MKRKDQIAVTVISLFAVGVLVYLLAPGVLGSKRQTTNDAFVAADFTLVAPRVAGFIKEVLVEDNQQRQGRAVAGVDRRPRLSRRRPGRRCRHPGGPGPAEKRQWRPWSGRAR